MSHKKDDFSVGICFSLTSFLTEMWKLFCSSGRHHEHEERSARHSFFSTTYPCIWNWCGKFGLAEKNLTSRTLLEDPHFLSDWFTTQQLNWQLPYRSKLKVRFGQKSKFLKQCKQRFEENVEKNSSNWLILRKYCGFDGKILLFYCGYVCAQLWAHEVYLKKN